MTVFDRTPRDELKQVDSPLLNTHHAATPEQLAADLEHKATLMLFDAIDNSDVTSLKKLDALQTLADRKLIGPDSYRHYMRIVILGARKGEQVDVARKLLELADAKALHF